MSTAALEMFRELRVLKPQGTVNVVVQMQATMGPFGIHCPH